MHDLEKINWIEFLSIGNNGINKDHKVLIDICNELIDLILLGNNREEFAIILSKLSDYTLIHLKKEEHLMQKHAYPQVSSHISEHINLMYKVAKFNFDFYSNNPPKPKEIIRLIKTWLNEHVMKCDAEYEIFKNNL